MRTCRNLFERVIATDNLFAAWSDARRGKRRRPDVARFELDAESRLLDLRRLLLSGEWRPGRYRTHVLREPKKRLIAAAPFADRVVHHAIHRVIEPPLTRRFLPGTFACRPGFGTHRGVLAFRGGLLRHRFVARLDIRRYFLEVDHRVLLAVLGRTIRDRRMMELLARILSSGAALYSDPRVLDALGVGAVYRPSPAKGLPIGNLTSQLFANLYLDGLDHFVKRERKVAGYCRYMDDVVLFGDRKGELRDHLDACVDWLTRERRLEAHRLVVTRTEGEHRFLGHVVSRAGIRPRARTVKRLVRRAREKGRLAGSERRRDEWERELVANVRAVSL
ncbi:MAG: group II intron reverse transcriptase domain-containing protein [Planctomycetes bacterium]|nr:group II intron reverse transcriptase domain-containing protein [Planctomycetota bacterium]